MKNKVLEIVNNHNSGVFIASFVEYVPERLKNAIALKMDTQTKRCCRDADHVEYHYRCYLSGQDKDLKRTFFEVRRFLDHGHHEFVIVHIVKELREFILQHEFYELMPRLESSFKKLIKLMKTYRPGVMRCITQIH
jgi:hypothetical protein